MNKYIVVTTINAKSKALEALEKLPDWGMIIVGDEKSVPIKSQNNVRYLSITDQLDLGFRSAKNLPLNHYSRKNVGYLFAIQQGAQIIYDTDDDNHPKADWRVMSSNCDRMINTSSKYFNIYRYYYDTFIWPRGFPLDDLHSDNDNYSVEMLKEALPIGIWQGMSDKDPDVDAIFRLLFPGDVIVSDKAPICLPKKVYCPINSQNTFWFKESFPFLYLPVSVSFRFTDILRGYIAQYLLWEKGFHVGYHKAFVRQDRNYHDLMKDLGQEIEGNLNLKKIIEQVEAVQNGKNEYEKLLNIYELLNAKGFVSKVDVEICNSWLIDLEGIYGKN